MTLTKNKLEDIIEVTAALSEIALKCECCDCAPQFKRVIQDYHNRHSSYGCGRQSGSSLDLRDQAARGRNGSVDSNIVTHSST